MMTRRRRPEEDGGGREAERRHFVCDNKVIVCEREEVAEDNGREVLAACAGGRDPGRPGTDRGSESGPAGAWTKATGRQDSLLGLALLRGCWCYDNE